MSYAEAYKKNTQVIVQGKLFKIHVFNEQVAFRYLILNKKIPAKNIIHGKDMPRVSYKKKKSDEYRKYIPDFYIPTQNRLIEVKTQYQLGLIEKWFNELKSKRLGVIKAGYKFSLLVFNEEGNRIKFPQYWYKLTLKQIHNIEEKAKKASFKRMIKKGLYVKSVTAYRTADQVILLSSEWKKGLK